jgi:UDP-N-acetylmuramate--alanine ligase
MHPQPRVHLVGIAGSGMRSLADLLAAAGWQVSGSDVALDPSLVGRFQVRAGHHADVVDPSLDLVVHSDAVAADNPELVRAHALQVPCRSYPQMLGELMASRKGLAVAGTHGKSTTAAMAAEILATEGLDPTVVYGARDVDGRSGGRLGTSRWMIAEACEYRANFKALSPQMAVVLNIEHDHFDCFTTPEHVEAAFAEFAARVPPDGLVLYAAECPRTRRAMRDLDCVGETFGLSPSATWQARNLRERRGFYSFRIRARERLICDVALRVPGRHNVYNALAAAALASHCGATGRAIHEGLERFAGLQRRIETLVDTPDLAVVDDYAHHPTEVFATLSTVRQMFPGRRVWCVFQPHQASRLSQLCEDFSRSLADADKIVVAETFRTREPDDLGGGATAAELARRVAGRGGDVVQLTSAAAIEHHLRQHLAWSDVLVTVGAGDIGTVAHGFRHYGFGQRARTVRQAG